MEWKTGAVLDERWIRSLHVESMRQADLHAEHDAHVLFQASTIGALLDGSYDGDLSFAELAEHGDLGLGTLNGLDGEMIALDGELLPRRRRRRRSTRSPPRSETPFAVVTGFEPTVEARARGGARPRRAAGAARRAGPGRRLLLRDPPRRPLRAGPRPLGPAPAAALPAADRGRRRPARLRARPTSPGRCSASASPPTSRGSRSPATTSTSSATTAPAAATSSTRARAGCGSRIDPSDDLHVELPPASRASPTPTSPPRPTRRSTRAEGG